jgi:hypothetical protein
MGLAGRKALAKALVAVGAGQGLADRLAAMVALPVPLAIRLGTAASAEHTVVVVVGMALETITHGTHKPLSLT